MSETPDPVAATPSAKVCADCGHPFASHRSGGCMATHYVTFRYGDTATPCHCAGFKVKL